MKKSFITLALLIVVVPWLGFPQFWKDTFVTIAGILIIVLVIIPRRELSLMNKTKKETSFTESNPLPKEKTEEILAHE